MIKVAVITPANDHVHTAYHSSMMGMAKYMRTHPEIEYEHHIVCSSILPHSRTHLARYAIERDCTHMLWIDSDMQFPCEVMWQLLSHGEPIVAANCMSRRPPYAMNARSEDSECIATFEHSRGLEKVYRVGFGLVMIETRVFLSLDEPWFETPWQPDKQGYRGEDFYFIDKAREKGWPILIDHDLSKFVFHVGVWGFGTAMYRPETNKGE